MNLFFLIAGNIILCLLVFCITKDFLHPGFLFCIPWTVFLILLTISNFDYDSSSFCYLYFFIGTVIFEIGCFLGQRNLKNGERLIEHAKTYSINYKNLKLLLFIESLFVAFILLYYISFMHSHFSTNIFLTFHSNREDMTYTGLIGYGRNLFSAFGICMIIGYSYVPTHERIRYKKYIAAQILMYFILTITRITRNQILFAALPFFMVFIVVTKQNNIQVFKKMLIAVILFLILFGVIAVMKYAALFSSGDYLDKIFKQVISYGSGGIVAFQKKFDANSFLNYGGSNTFRFFQAILDKIAGTSYAKPLVQEFISIGRGTVTNVYTFYQWYVNDFGIIYALFIQFIVGILHGISYKKCHR